MQRPRRLAAVLAGVLAVAGGAAAQAPPLANFDPLTGPRSRLSKNWLGLTQLPSGTEILVLAGHADSQGIGGAGTGGAAVDLGGAAPMQPGIRDELYWNLLTAQAVVALGKQRGLAIRFYDPPLRTIADGDDPRTNWSVGKAHAQAGGYALEIHYDAYGPDGVGSGLIPPLHRLPTRLDESLAVAFGPYPLLFRNGLGAPRRGIAILEVGKLEGQLEASLRDPRSRDAALQAVAERVVSALQQGLQQGLQPALQAPGLAAAQPASISPTASSPPGGGHSGQQASHPLANPGDE